jgi:hypothetical protein
MNVNKVDINNEINKQKSHAYKDSITSANEETCKKSLMIQKEQYEVVNHRRINKLISNLSMANHFLLVVVSFHILMLCKTT